MTTKDFPQADLPIESATGNLTIFGFDCPAWCWSIPPMLFGLIGAVNGWSFQ